MFTKENVDYTTYIFLFQVLFFIPCLVSLYETAPAIGMTWQIRQPSLFGFDPWPEPDPARYGASIYPDPTPDPDPIYLRRTVVFGGYFGKLQATYGNGNNWPTPPWGIVRFGAFEDPWPEPDPVYRQGNAVLNGDQGWPGPPW